ncbi:hypothetical protein D3C75_1233260 [compost metagenome]
MGVVLQFRLVSQQANQLFVPRQPGIFFHNQRSVLRQFKVAAQSFTQRQGLPLNLNQFVTFQPQQLY